MGKKKSFIIVAFLSLVILSIFFTVIYDSGEINYPDLPYNSDNYEAELMTDNYVIREVIDEEDQSNVYIKRLNSGEEITIEPDLLNSLKSNVNFGTMKSHKNTIYYLRRDLKNTMSIVSLDIDKFQYKTLYQSTPQKKEISLFGVSLWSSMVSSDIMLSERIDDFILAGDVIILIKDSNVSLFNGKDEEVIIDKKILGYSYCNRVLTYRDSLNRLFQYNIDERKESFKD